MTQEQLGRIAAFAKERRFADGELLWKQGDCDRPLFAVLEGGVAAAVGEGSVCVQLVHRVLAE